MTNQEIYSEYGIQPNDTNKIAQKLGIPAGDYSDEALGQIRSIYSEAKKSGLSLTKYLAEIEVAQQSSAPASPATPRADRVQAPVDGSAVNDFQLTIASTSERLAQGSLQVLRNMDVHLENNESSFADAMVERITQSPARAARKVIDRLSHEQPNFFQFAPTGASGALTSGAAAILALPDSGSQSGYAALKSATVVEDAETTQQPGE